MVSRGAAKPLTKAGVIGAHGASIAGGCPPGGCAVASWHQRTKPLIDLLVKTNVTTAHLDDGALPVDGNKPPADGKRLLLGRRQRWQQHRRLSRKRLVRGSQEER